jgi:hypothetical protein
VSALLDDIINLAVDGKQSLPDILRKCLLLGHEIKNERLKAWANQELNGYDGPDSLPEYRVLDAEAKGNFSGPFGSGANNWPIPSVALAKEHRDFGERVYLLQAVSAFQDVMNQEPCGDIQFPWHGNLVLRYQTHFFQGRYALVTAWQEVSKSRIVELLDTIRNRTLNLALQIKDELGTSYADLRRIQSTDAMKIQSIVFNNLGGTANIAFGGNVDASGQTVITVGDRKALDAALSQAGLDEGDLDGLTEAIKRTARSREIKLERG